MSADWIRMSRVVVSVTNPITAGVETMRSETVHLSRLNPMSGRAQPPRERRYGLWAVQNWAPEPAAFHLASEQIRLPEYNYVVFMATPEDVVNTLEGIDIGRSAINEKIYR
ncbi:hypothetical protein K443DRAFT_502734 [Laccaria amethystina LaAM-08-1]|uniref:Uncharacterized protein n=1 Tax=Laccaria amethystina LaAM-08-1 TaxID=1095629 RepID=A0A0C9Y4F9_9AGAR|nr:hypothetical protein K443DRAFT_502734 [Laccaria amethystina LaAM-08-1]